MIAKILDKIAEFILRPSPVKINEADMKKKRDEYKKLAKEDPEK